MDERVLLADGGAGRQQTRGVYPEGENIDVICMACTGPECDFKPVRMQRRPVGPHDVLIDMKFCGVCHSDMHFAGGHIPNYAMRASYVPGCVPGHELAGVVEAVGPEVTTVAVGSRVGVGCLVDSCRSCGKCKSNEEQMCIRQAIGTYGSKVDTTPSQRKMQGRSATPCGYTLGGYSLSLSLSLCVRVCVCVCVCVCACVTIELSGVGIQQKWLWTNTSRSRFPIATR